MNEWRVGVGFKEFLYRSGEVENFGWHTIDKVGSGKDDISPEYFRDISFYHNGSSYFYEMSILPFSHSILLRGVHKKRFGGGYLVWLKTLS